MLSCFEDPQHTTRYVVDVLDRVLDVLDRLLVAMSLRLFTVASRLTLSLAVLRCEICGVRR